MRLEGALQSGYPSKYRQDRVLTSIRIGDIP